MFASLTLALCLLFLTGLLANLPKVILAAVVPYAVSGLIDFPALTRMWSISKIDFYAAAVALGAVLLLGIPAGHIACGIGLTPAAARSKHRGFIGRIPGKNNYFDLARHPDNEPLPD